MPANRFHAPPVLRPPHVLAWSESRLAQTDDERPAIALWLPEGVSIAIGVSQKPEIEIDLDAAEADAVPVVRRQSGGGAVVLMPGVLCWEAWASETALAGRSGIREAYAALSGPVVAALSGIGLAASSAGVSDISVRRREGEAAAKIAGTAQLRRQGRILVHGSLLVDADIGLMEQYLRRPSSEPEYRAGRRHREFCANVAELVREAGKGLLKGIAEAALGEAVAAGWRIEIPPATLPESAGTLLASKYDNPEWNLRRARTA